LLQTGKADGCTVTVPCSCRASSKLLRKAIEDDPKYKKGFLHLCLIFAQQKRKSKAEEELNKAIVLEPSDPATISAAGKVEMQMGKSSEGIGLLRKSSRSRARTHPGPRGVQEQRLEVFTPWAKSILVAHNHTIA
jgi:hypothetical protein